MCTYSASDWLWRAPTLPLIGSDVPLLCLWLALTCLYSASDWLWRAPTLPLIGSDVPLLCLWLALTCLYSASDWLWPWYSFSVNGVGEKIRHVWSDLKDSGRSRHFCYWWVTAILSTNLSPILRFVSCYTCRKQRAQFVAGRNVFSVTLTIRQDSLCVCRLR